MFKLKHPEIFASDIAGFLNKDFTGKDFIVNQLSSYSNPQNHSLLYVKKGKPVPSLNGLKGVLVLSDEPVKNEEEGCAIITVENPKLEFIKVANEFYVESETAAISSSARISEKANIGRNVTIGENVVIGPEVTVGENTCISPNTIITGRVKIGKNCLIGGNSTIGSGGYNFETDEKGNPMHHPPLGEIIIGNQVWIGSNTSIEMAAFDQTIIGDLVKIDDLVQIGYNCTIDEKCMITAGVILNRNVKIGKNSLIAPNACVRDDMSIGQGATIGTGSVVIKDVPDNTVCAGNPAKPLKK